MIAQPLVMLQDTAPPPLPDRDLAMRKGMSMLLLVSILTLILLLSLTVIVIQRRSRRRRSIKTRSAPPHPEVDPWTESARRLDDSLTTIDDFDDLDDDLP